jgi:hypothetical protein
VLFPYNFIIKNYAFSILNGAFPESEMAPFVVAEYISEDENYRLYYLKVLISYHSTKRQSAPLFSNWTPALQIHPP